MTNDESTSVQHEYANLKTSYENAVTLLETNTKKVVVLNFKALQLLRIKTLQQELFTLQMKLTLGGFSPQEYPVKLEQLDATLAQYGKALESYDLLSQNSLDSIPPGSTVFGTPDELISKPLDPPPRSLLDLLLRREPRAETQYAVRDWTKFTRFQDKATGGDYILNGSLHYRELDKDGREARAQKNAFSERLWMAIFGGVALLVPVIIMTMVKGVIASLVTTSVAILLFAFILAVFASNTLGKDLLAATAAYAAVLVVFIGASSTPGS